MEPLYDGPHQVEAPGDKVFRLLISPRLETVSVDRLKPYLGLESLPLHRHLQEAAHRVWPIEVRLWTAGLCSPRQAAVCGGRWCGGMDL
jgi:hypothetical protein